MFDSTFSYVVTLLSVVFAPLCFLVACCRFCHTVETVLYVYNRRQVQQSLAERRCRAAADYSGNFSD